LFIDDSLRNIEGAQAVGLPGIHFKNPEQLKSDLRKLNVLP
jgi:2-haloacid dehalogenase